MYLPGFLSTGHTAAEGKEAEPWDTSFNRVCCAQSLISYKPLVWAISHTHVGQNQGLNFRAAGSQRQRSSACYVHGNRGLFIVAPQEALICIKICNDWITLQCLYLRITECSHQSPQQLKLQLIPRICSEGSLHRKETWPLYRRNNCCVYSKDASPIPWSSNVVRSSARD